MRLEEALFADAFPCQGRSVRPSDIACRYMINQIAAILSEAPKDLHREGGEFVAALVEGHQVPVIHAMCWVVIIMMSYRPRDAPRV